MNWPTVADSLRSLAKGSADTPRALVMLRQEVVATTLLGADEKDDLHQILDRLQRANLYGQIALVSQLKEILSKHAGFTAQYAEFSLPKRPESSE